MLREIISARSNNIMSHMLSRSQLKTENMPGPTHLLSEMNANRQPDTDRRTAGIKQTGKSVVNNIRINYLA